MLLISELKKKKKKTLISEKEDTRVITEHC